MFVNKADFDILEKVQERAFRYIHIDFVSDKRLLLEQSKDISIRLVTMRCLALGVFKCMNGLSPSYIKDLFETNINSYDLGDNKKLVQPRVKTTLYGLQSDITEPTYGICCPFNMKTAWMFMISENYCLYSMDRIAHVLFACKQDEIL